MLRRTFWLVWPAVVLLGLALVGWHAWNLLGFEGQFVNELRPTAAIDLVAGMRLGQSFVAPRAGLERVDVLLYGYERRNTQPVSFHLRLAGADRDEVTATFDAGEVWGWRWMTFRFPPLAGSQGQTYEFFFESPTSKPGDAITLGGVEGDLYPYGTAIINGQPAFADAAFETYYAGISPDEKMAALVAQLTRGKPSLWGDVRLYALLGLLYLLLVLRLLWRIWGRSVQGSELPSAGLEIRRERTP